MIRRRAHASATTRSARVRSFLRLHLLDVATVGWYVLLTAVSLWPLLTALDSAVAHNIRDTGFQATVLFDVSTRLEHLDLVHLFDGYFFYPAPFTLALADDQIGLQVLALPLHLAGLDALLVLNILTILSYPVTALAGDALGRYVTRSRAGGLIVGTAFGFAAFRLEHVIHLELLQSWTIALAFLGLEMTLREPSRRGPLLWAFALVAAAATSLNYLVLLVVVQPPYAAARCVLGPRRGELLRRLRRLVAPALIAAIPIAALVYPYVVLKGEGYTRTTADTFLFSARAIDYLMPAADTQALGWLFRLHPPATGPDERELLPGLIVLMASSAGIAVVLLRREWPRLRRLLPWVAAGSVAFVFSLGPYLWPDTDQLPADLGNLVSLPYRYLAGPLFLDSIRVPARFGVIVLLALAVCAAMAVVRGLAHVPRGWPRAVVLGVVAVGMAVEYSVALPVETVAWGADLPPVYQFLRSQPAGPVVELPVDTVDESFYMLASTVDGHPRLNGWSGFTPTQSEAIESPVSAASLPAWLAAARRLGAQYIVIHADAVDATTLAAVHADRDAGALSPIGMFATDEVYRFGRSP